jgi:isopentenyl diphosphate isomerase/L-lactate dehydrogenase-like FMN-dependent dehydrogenase
MNYNCVSDLVNLAKEKLPSDIFDFVAGGAMDELTLNRNEAAFKEQLLLPRCLRPVNTLNTSIQLFGMNLSVPFLASPIAFQSLAHTDGEIGTIRAIEAFKSGMILSTMSSKRLEHIADEANDAVLYFQLYIYKDRTFTENLIRRAERANYRAIVITIDVPIMGRRYRDMQNKFKLPTHCIAENLPQALVSKRRSGASPDKSHCN